MFSFQKRSYIITFYIRAKKICTVENFENISVAARGLESKPEPWIERKLKPKPLKSLFSRGGSNTGL